MGWANCGEDSKGRPIGYSHLAICDHPGCSAQIDRGLAYACGGMHGTDILGGDGRIDWSGDFGSCEGYFCERHLRGADMEHEDGKETYSPSFCVACASRVERLYWTDADYRDLWPTKAGPATYSQADRSAERQDREDGLGPQGESGGPAQQDASETRCPNPTLIRNT